MSEQKCVCLTSSLLAAQGPARRVCSSFAARLFVFPFTGATTSWSPLALKSCHNSGGTGTGEVGCGGGRATNTAGRPTHNAARQATEITKPLRLLRADVLNPPSLQPSSGD